MSKLVAWNVYLKDSLIDTVFHTLNCTRGEVYNSLVDHGYDPNIIVRLPMSFHPHTEEKKK